MTKKKRNKLTQKELKRQLHYDPVTGIFTRLTSNCNRVKVGSTISSYDNYYTAILVNNKRYPAHRLAYLYMKGYFPEHEVDHKNGIVNDNRWENLRHVTRSCNMQNLKIFEHNTSGFPGVCWAENVKKWKSRITINRKTSHIGCYDTALEAALARFTVEDQCRLWICNYRSELAKAIKDAWPEFRFYKEE